MQPGTRRELARRPEVVAHPRGCRVELRGFRHAQPLPLRAAPLPRYFAIYTPDVGHVPCVLPSVTSDAALGNCVVALVFTAIHASVK